MLYLLIAIILAAFQVFLNTTSGITETQVRNWFNLAGYEEHTLLAQVNVVDTGLTVSSVGCETTAGQPLQAAIQLNSSGLLSHPHLDTSHEYGHVWSQYYRCLYWGNSFDPYLMARGIFGAPWLDYSAPTCRNPIELMAHDYEQLFGNINDGGSVVYASCSQQEWMVGLQEPYNVTGFRDWYGLIFTQNHPPPGYSGSVATPTPIATNTPAATATSTPATNTPTPVGTCFPPRAKRCR
jgi:hypothetical protein